MVTNTPENAVRILTAPINYFSLEDRQPFRLKMIYSTYIVN